MSVNTSDPSATPNRGPVQAPYPPVMSPAPTPSAVLRSPRGLATAVTVLLAVGAAVDLFSAGVNLYTRQLMEDFGADPGSVEEDTLNLSDSLTAMTGLAQVALRLATMVVFIIWFHRVRSNGQVFRPDGFTQSTGWAIGGWFVPIAQFFFPYRTARETWEASIQLAPDGSYRRVSNAPVTAWWLMFVAMMLIDRAFGSLYERAETAEEIGGASALGAVSDLSAVVAAVLAFLFVRRLTALQEIKAAQGPYAAV
ncbi:DUF4328 domain-containing protein [Streptomyces sp. NPDC087917]|uniref:DUF4328 domain-containing protein n=1 Tax=unclassified Streptomyces TaxID=2593676 RepID=UPI00342A4A58